jgi:hypothetical protein
MRVTRPGRLAAALLAALITLLVACGSRSESNASSRPRSNAQLQIVNPVPNAVTTPTFTLQFSLEGATVSPPTVLTPAPNQGHIHVSIDGKLISMSYGLTQPVNNLTPGTHTLQAEFVANDHRPFENRVLTAVVFSVKG